MCGGCAGGGGMGSTNICQHLVRARYCDKKFIGNPHSRFGIIPLYKEENEI